MINRVVLVGRLTKDPELRYTPSGLPVARFTIAVNRQFSNQQGEREADFINCVAWRKSAEFLANYMKKGSLIGVDGRIQTGSYEGQDGKRVYTTEVVVDNVQSLESRNSQGGQQPANQQYGNSGQGGYGNTYGNANQAPQQQFGGAPQQGGGMMNEADPFASAPSYQQNQPTPNQQNYTRIEEKPFGSNNQGGTIDVSEDDLPF